MLGCFSAVSMRQNITEIPPDCDRLAEKLALLHLKRFPRPFSNHAMECNRGIGEGTREPAYVLSKGCQLK